VDVTVCDGVLDTEAPPDKVAVVDAVCEGVLVGVTVFEVV
jgi:hypothetical protein